MIGRPDTLAIQYDITALKTNWSRVGRESCETLLPLTNEVWSKVIFSQVSVCPHGEGGLPETPVSPGQRPSLDRNPLTVKSGRHASYWNACLFKINPTVLMAIAGHFFEQRWDNNWYLTWPPVCIDGSVGALESQVGMNGYLTMLIYELLC